MQEITDIMGCKNNIQLLCQLINSIFDIDVFFVNKDMTALAGTGHYKKNIGTKRPRESFVDLALHSGELHIIGEPRYAPQCYKCEYREICPYKMGMVCPLTLKVLPFIMQGQLQRPTLSLSSEQPVQRAGR